MHHFFMLNLMVHIVTTLSFTELKKFLYNTFTGNTMNPNPNVLSARPTCKLLLLLLPLLSLSSLRSSFTNAVQISVSTTNVINRTHARNPSYTVSQDKHRRSLHKLQRHLSHSLHRLTPTVPRIRQKHSSPCNRQ